MPASKTGEISPLCWPRLARLQQQLGLIGSLFVSNHTRQTTYRSNLEKAVKWGTHLISLWQTRCAKILRMYGEKGHWIHACYLYNRLLTTVWCPLGNTLEMMRCHADRVGVIGFFRINISWAIATDSNFLVILLLSSWTRGHNGGETSIHGQGIKRGDWC